MFKAWMSGVFPFLGALPCAAISTQADLDLLRERMLVTESSEDRRPSSELSAWLSSQKADGSWGNRDYQHPRTDLNGANDHTVRLKYLARELLHGTSTIGGYDLKTQIGKGLDYYTQYAYTPKTGFFCGDRYALAAQTFLADQSKCQAGSTLFTKGSDGKWTNMPTNGNFTNQFFESQDVGRVLLILKHTQSFPEATLKRWATWINSSLQSGFGSHQIYAFWNLSQSGFGIVCKGILQGDVRMVDSTFKLLGLQTQYSYDPIEGRQADQSVNEHTQLYAGGYPDWYLGDLHHWWLGWAGNYSMGWKPEIKQNLVDMIMDGYLPMTQFGQYDPTVVGRSITNPWFHGDVTSLVNILNDLARDPAYSSYRQQEVQSALGLLNSNPIAWPWPKRSAQLFYNNDYATLHQGKWLLSYRYASQRIGAGENFNGENRKGIYLHLGVYWLHHQRPFDNNLFPVMDWTALPGLTMERTATVPKFPAFPLGSGSFAGGAVSGGEGNLNAGSTAAIGYDYDVAAIKGSKAAFFLDGYAVFLGAGLNFSKTSPVTTTVNQQLAVGPTWVQRSGSAPTALAAAPQDVKANNIVSVWHDSVGYAFPTPTAMEVVIGDSTGLWTDIDTVINLTKYKKTLPNSVTKPVFTSWINHGTSATPATPASYAYAIVPGIAQTNFASWMANVPYSVEKNTASVQAVLAQDKNWHGVIFHQAGELTFSDKLYLKSDVPSAVILRVTPDYFYLSVADPAHKSTSVNLTLSVPLSGNGATWDNATKRSTIKVALGTDVKTKGKTVMLAFKKIPPVGISEAPPTGSTHLFRSGDNLFVRELPVGTTHLTLVDVQGKILRAWAATSSEARLELPRQVQSGFLLIDGATRTSLAVPPRL